MKYKLKLAFAGAVLFCFAVEQGLADIDATEDFILEQLRDPFWPVGYFPDGWQAGGADEDELSATVGSDWDAPAALIRVTGTSRMGDKTVAIINGDLKEEGDLVQVSYSGRIYQWKLSGVNANGKVSLERVGISSGVGGFKSGDK